MPGLSHLGERFNLDPNRIYLVGMSDGGLVRPTCCVRWRVSPPSVTHSGTQPVRAAAPVRAFPILLLVGADDLVLNAIRSDATQYRDGGHPVELIVVPGLGHRFGLTDHNGAM